MRVVTSSDIILNTKTSIPGLDSQECFNISLGVVKKKLGSLIY